MPRAAFVWLCVIVLADAAAGAAETLPPIPLSRSLTIADDEPPSQLVAPPEPLPDNPAEPGGAPYAWGAGRHHRLGWHRGSASQAWADSWANFKRKMQASHWGYPEEFLGVNAGTSLRRYQELQIANGMAARFVLYASDFAPDAGRDGPCLSAAGARRLNGWLAELRTGPQASVMIERSLGNQALDEARVTHVTDQLQSANVAARVILGDPPVPGLRGDEARALAEAFRRSIERSGRVPGSAPSSSGNSGGAEPKAE